MHTSERGRAAMAGEHSTEQSRTVTLFKSPFSPYLMVSNSPLSTGSTNMQYRASTSRSVPSTPSHRNNDALLQLTVPPSMLQTSLLSAQLSEQLYGTVERPDGRSIT